MQTYVILWTFTDQGMKNIKTLPERVQDNISLAEQGGFKVISSYLTQGQYDFVTIVEAPDEQSLMAALFSIASGGNSRSETLRAFQMTEVQQIVQRLP
jgi:uncharacterized protein with GYD domain